MVIDNRLEGPSDDGSAVGSVQGRAAPGSATDFPSDGVHTPCIANSLSIDASQTLECLLLVVAVVATSHVEELSRLVLVQGISPVWPCPRGGASRVHDDLVERRLVVGFGANVLKMGSNGVGTGRFAEYLDKGQRKV